MENQITIRKDGKNWSPHGVVGLDCVSIANSHGASIEVIVRSSDDPEPEDAHRGLFIPSEGHVTLRGLPDKATIIYMRIVSKGSTAYLSIYPGLEIS